MPKNHTKGTVKNLFLFFLLIIFLVLLAVFRIDIWMILSVLIWCIMIFVCLKDVSVNGFFLFFLFSFFIFLMSGDIAEAFFDKHYHLQFGKDATLHAHKSIFISLLAMWIGYVFTKSKQKKTTSYVISSNNSNMAVGEIRSVSKWVYAVAYFLIVINTLDTIRFVASYGYVAYYTSFNPILPSILVEVGEFTPLALCVYLSTFPTKKESSLIIKSFLLYSLLTLLIGSRSGVIYNTSFIICYGLYRNHTDKGEDVWISKKLIAVLLISVPFLLSFLFLYEYIRTGRDFEYTSLGDSIVDFFINIGSASQNIKYGYEYRERIPNFRFYSLGGTLNYFKYGKLFNLFNLESIPSRHTVKFALESHSFADLISYLTIPQEYLQGNGAGSSFIAELFADFGYIGVALGSAIYGWIFKKMAYISNRHWLSTTIKLFVFFTMLSAPRASFDGFIAAILNVKHILFISLIYFFAQSMSKKIRELRC